ncbi:TPA: DUF2635 domain-containing protein [Burkholderia vietnamiensis]|uniref:DUF2635 domain-containing protein n=1 Tax=Burkholderia cepacia complex TaxID=87882 RepID=UPI0007545C01|nr:MULTISPECIES: DUF2635 domain-containing protein [Burkholderia cepacia complex]KVE13219.1 hypothetical protein WI92_14820 [Burkholderia vietnamiensis]KVF35377.1 hypothetical protein WJ09_10385 [Burkholderia vietnamiensis]KVS43819.1 hypothetical protein WK35_23690 [Burkholderia vietnamiensis]MBU9439398.1 DUF2635 domain-containing protein [Burkholderia multivorans]HDR8994786.1 DUF2635 domain-containing protein [Burkholderia vietnamiensis]
MEVKARSGLRVPKEHASRQYITDAEAVDVPDTAYYHRRVAEGDLIEENRPAAESSADVAPSPAVDSGVKKAAKGA